MTIGKWTLIECDYCQGAIGEMPAWQGGYPFHKECLRLRDQQLAGYLNELQRQVKEDAERYPG